MKTQKFFILISLVAIVPMLIIPEPWKITSLDWQPYSGFDMANQGNFIQKLKELLKSEGSEVIVKFYLWERAQQSVKTSEDFVCFPVNIDYIQNEKQLIKKLSEKRFYAVITDPNVALYHAKLEGVTHIKYF